MYEQEDADVFYLAGRKLAAHIAYFKEKDISIATLQALIRDLLPEHEEVQEALRSIVARPGFLQLVQLAGSEKGVAQKCVFSESLRKIYSAETVTAADSLVCGMIGLGITTAEHESAVKKIFIDTVPQQSKDNGVQAETQGANSTEKRHVQGKSREIVDNISPAPPSHSLKNTELTWTVSLALGLVVVASFAAGGIRDGIRDRLPEAKVEINQKLSAIDPSSPYHVRVGSPSQMPNNTGVSNELLAEAILASAIFQCESIYDQNGGYEESIKRYRSYIDKKNIENRVTNSNTFVLLSASLRETMAKNRKGVLSGSCGSISDNKAVEKVKEWLL